MGRHGKGGPRYSFGTASRDDGSMYSQSAPGSASPGPATYNTRTPDFEGGKSFTRDGNRCARRRLHARRALRPGLFPCRVLTRAAAVGRAMSRGAPCSPGPIYNVVNNGHSGRGTTLGGKNGFVFGKPGERNGHQPINNPNLASPGPKYNLQNNEFAGKGTTVSNDGKQGFTFRGGKLRGTERVVIETKPGPGAHDVPDMCGPGTGAAEWGFGSSTRPPLNDNKDSINTPAPNAYTIKSANRSGVAPNVGLLDSKSVVVQQGKGSQTADRFGEAKNSFATNAPGPGTYRTEQHMSIGGVTGETAPSYSMAALNGFEARAVAARSPGPKYNTTRPLGDTVRRNPFACQRSIVSGSQVAWLCAGSVCQLHQGGPRQPEEFDGGLRAVARPCDSTPREPHQR